LPSQCKYGNTEDKYLFCGILQKQPHAFGEHSMANKPPLIKTAGIDPDLVRELARLVSETDLSEIEIEKGDLRIRVARTVSAAVTIPVMQHAPMMHHAAPVAAPLAPAAAPAAVSAVAVQDPADDYSTHAGAVPSPMVGAAYLRAAPGAKAFVEIGDVVEAGAKLLLIEAMKTFNEITAPRGGKILAILVQDGQPVEYGEPLLVIE
jgi:acetyl-CoA carboxylase biotin carboxyl carrier protein